MYSHRAPQARVDVVDLDPYGTAAPFIDAAVQQIDGLLLCNYGCTHPSHWHATLCLLFAQHRVALLAEQSSLEDLLQPQPQRDGNVDGGFVAFPCPAGEI